MNIIDTNGVSHIFANNLVLQEDYYLVPDVMEEVELTQLVHGKRVPSKVSDITQTNLFDRTTYLNYYKNALNKNGGKSFYNMTGFGDISIIATLHMLIDIFDKQRQTQLFGDFEEIVVYTDDNRLTKIIDTEFKGKGVIVHPVGKIS